MVPTLFGVTVVSFVIMQLAPGDPVMYQLQGGSAGRSNQTREAYLIQKRDLHLDKPLVLNFRNFRDYSSAVHWAAFYRARSVDEIREDCGLLPTTLMTRPTSSDSTSCDRWAFLISRPALPTRNNGICSRNRSSITRWSFARTSGRTQSPPPSPSCKTRNPSLKLKIGAIRCLNPMVVDPFVLHLFSASERRRNAGGDGCLANLVGAPQRRPSGGRLRRQKVSRRQAGGNGCRPCENRCGPRANCQRRLRGRRPALFCRKIAEPCNAAWTRNFVASVYLKRVFSEPLKVDVATNASAAEVAEAAGNWLEHYQLHQSEYEPSTLAKLWYIVGDTQYSHMVARLVTFHFGRSTLKTHEPVSDRIWEAFIVSAPLMFMSELLIYIVAVPLGILCGVFRSGWTDRGISFGLFVLVLRAAVCGRRCCFSCFFATAIISNGCKDTSVGFPSRRKVFIRTMLKRCRGWPILRDYLWHAFLPVVCLSLFSLAAIAMYSRSAILDVINQDYIRTARAKGLGGQKVVLKHALRNAADSDLDAVQQLSCRQCWVEVSSSNRFSIYPVWDN